jgi:glycosyltransferase involved in cell wall biosynthesis
MRILLLAQFYPPVIGGEERHVRNLAVELAGRGHDVHVATLDTGDAPVHDAGVTVHLLRNNGSRFPGLYSAAEQPLALPLPDPLTTRDLSALARDLRPDVVHAHNWIINSWIALPTASRTPLVYSLHDYSHVCPTKRLVFEGEPCSGPSVRKCFGCAREHYQGTRGTVIQAAVRGGRPWREHVVDVFAPVSSYVAAANRLEAQGLAWETVPNFVPDALLDADTSPRDPDLPEGGYLFFAGDLSAQKGVLTLLAAYRRLDEATRPALVLVGKPSVDLGALPAGAEVHQHWTHDRVVSGFQHALAACLPSEWPDPCPTTVLEAMALGAPLVTTDAGGIADMVEADVSALVARPGDEAHLAEQLTRIVADADLRRRLRESGRVRVRGFLASSVATQLERIYASLI